MREGPPIFDLEFPRRQRRLPRLRAVWWIIALLVLIILLTLSSTLVNFYTDLLWFQSLGYASVYWTTIWARFGSFVAGFLATIVILGGNVWLARFLTRREPLYLGQQRPLEHGVVNLVLAGIVGFFALSFGGAAGAQWEELLRFIHQKPFGVADPIFGRDVGFYVFSLPIQRFARGWLFAALFLSLMAVAAIYTLSRLAQLQHRIFTLPRYIHTHLAALAALILLVIAWGYRLDRYDLLYSRRGVVFGAGYTDVHAQLLALNLLFVVAVMTALLILASIVTRNLWLPGIAIAGWLAIAFLVGGVYPGLVQRYQVEPNEFIRERPYIEHNIEFTRRAYGLDAVREQNFVPEDAINPETLRDNAATLQNVRLWDYRPLLQTYAQIQEIRPYYEFVDVDIDRYRFDGDYRQVMLAARELAPEQLQSRTWVNEHLEFTHGYGLVMSPVNEVTPEGLPVLYVRDLPPEVSVDLRIDRPEIYYGEKGGRYVFVKTRVQEFDYPRGDTNVRTTYQGKGGVSVGSLLNRLAFALRFGDSQIFFTDALTPESRILLYRNIHDRVRRVAPFLAYDRDPYLVVAGGRLVWLQDAYTLTDRYPYSQPVDSRFNYIRNSVKIVIDAYDGTLTFYIADRHDPLIQTYASIFPGLFRPIEQMPQSLRAHLRYPEDLFRVQTQVYATYHMKDPNVFYNKEDVWALPAEVYQGDQLPMEPYYVIMRLVGEEQEEFVLILPFTPAGKNNLIAWMAARCDGEHYGELVVYKFPKQELVYGPLQIEARIDQDPTISAQLSLWNQRGSRVIRGNLLVIPLGDSLVYFEPLYLQAEASQLPELKRVIVAFGEKVAMEETLDEALQAVFGGGPAIAREGEPLTTEGGEGGAVSPALADLIRAARQHYDAAQEALRQGDWATYGQELEALKEVLNEMARLTGLGE